MLFLEVEGERFINLHLVDEIQVKHGKREATLLSSGIIKVADSKIAYEYFFGANPQLLVLRNGG
jgi:hypothetical protein